MDKQQVANAVEGLNKAYPDGWRTGDPTYDALGVFIYHNLQQMVRILSAPRGKQ